MGTHPIFESDFDCLTGMNMSRDLTDVLDLGTDLDIENDFSLVGPPRANSSLPSSQNSKTVSDELLQKLEESFTDNVRENIKNSTAEYFRVWTAPRLITSIIPRVTLDKYGNAKKGLVLTRSIRRFEVLGSVLSSNVLNL